MNKRNFSRIRSAIIVTIRKPILYDCVCTFPVNSHYDIQVTLLIEWLKQYNRGIKEQIWFNRTECRMLIIDTFQRNDKHFSTSSKTRTSMVWKRIAHILYHSIGCSSIIQICLKWDNRYFPIHVRLEKVLMYFIIIQLTSNRILTYKLIKERP